MRGKAHPYCRVFEFLVSIVDGLGATTITEEVLFKHLGQQVLVTETMATAKKTVVDVKKAKHFWYDPTERTSGGASRFTVHTEGDDRSVAQIDSGVATGELRGKRISARFTRTGLTAGDPKEREVTRLHLQAVLDDEELMAGNEDTSV